MTELYQTFICDTGNEQANIDKFEFSNVYTEENILPSPKKVNNWLYLYIYIYI